MKDQLFADEGYPARFAFDERVAEVFDDMVERSVPDYCSVARLLAGLAVRFARPGRTVYDLGCSTGSFLIDLAARVDPAVRLIGVDSSAAMIHKAALRAQALDLTDRISWLEGDLATLPLDDAQVVVSAYTLQFVDPVKRPGIVGRIFEALPRGGALLIVEKTRPPEAIAELFREEYEAHKRFRGYSDTEIARKRLALEEVLRPYSIGENVELLRQAGFSQVEPFHQWLQFVGFLAIR